MTTLLQKIFTTLSTFYVLLSPNTLNKVGTNTNYSYYVFAVQKWCNNSYSIHGMWPQYDVDHYPSYCKNVDYKEPSGKLLDSMNSEWNSCNNNTQFWKHEWQKHGSCVEQQLGLQENGYFSMVLDVFEENKNQLKHCTRKDCTMGCFDLKNNLIDCPTNYHYHYPYLQNEDDDEDQMEQPPLIEMDHEREEFFRDALMLYED